MKELTLSGNRIAETRNNDGIKIMPMFVEFGDNLHRETATMGTTLNKLFPDLQADGLKLEKSMVYLAAKCSTVFGQLGYIPQISINRVQQFLPTYSKMPKNASQRDRVRFWQLACDMATMPADLANRFALAPAKKADSNALESGTIPGEISDRRIEDFVKLAIHAGKLDVLTASILKRIDGHELIKLLSAEQAAMDEEANKAHADQICASMAFCI